VRTASRCSFEDYGIDETMRSDGDGVFCVYKVAQTPGAITDIIMHIRCSIKIYFRADAVTF
jgi:hypothetical protein